MFRKVTKWSPFSYFFCPISLLIAAQFTIKCSNYSLTWEYFFVGQAVKSPSCGSKKRYESRFPFFFILQKRLCRSVKFLLYFLS